MSHRRIVARAFGGPEVLAVVDGDLPEPGPGEVRVSLRAIGVNPYDFKSYSGLFGADESKLPIALGSEASGVIDAVGADVSLDVGTEVVVYPAKGGSYADAVVVPETSVTAKPVNLSWEQAAGLLAAGVTAADLVETVATAAGDTVLVHGAAGAVGSVAVQLAAARGAVVIGTARANNHDYVRQLGATPVKYGPGLLDRVRASAPNGIDAAIDTVGSVEAADVSVELVSDPTRIVTTVPGPTAVERGITAVGGGDAASVENRRNARPQLIELAADGALNVRVAKVFALFDAAEAHRQLAGPHEPGKFVLIP
ncbi:NADP-dependent oxidoreductase [Rhodococcus sp. NPDC058521]|uniref:NADP-dependent oxidoreductase n=1 Tax=Rhodococcus sp. NPDC058521 TaxID=3346536 RepID=UPI00365984FE